MPILCLNLSQHNKLTRLIDVHTVTETGIQVITYDTYAVAREKKKIVKIIVVKIFIMYVYMVVG